jgi:hypothetical protein
MKGSVQIEYNGYKTGCVIHAPLNQQARVTMSLWSASHMPSTPTIWTAKGLHNKQTNRPYSSPYTMEQSFYTKKLTVAQSVTKFSASCDSQRFITVFTRAHPLPKGCHLDVVGGPSTPHDSESDAGGSLSSWQGHPSR